MSIPRGNSEGYQPHFDGIRPCAIVHYFLYVRQTAFPALATDDSLLPGECPRGYPVPWNRKRIAFRRGTLIIAFAFAQSNVKSFGWMHTVLGCRDQGLTGGPSLRAIKKATNRRAGRIPHSSFDILILHPRFQIYLGIPTE